MELIDTSMNNLFWLCFGFPTFFPSEKKNVEILIEVQQGTNTRIPLWFLPPILSLSHIETKMSQQKFPNPIFPFGEMRNVPISSRVVLSSSACDSQDIQGLEAKIRSFQSSNLFIPCCKRYHQQQRGLALIENPSISTLSILREKIYRV